jgi:chemotaxis protein methyltransferase CheR
MLARERFVGYWPLPLRAVPASEQKRVARILEAATGVAIRSDRERAFLEALYTRMVARLVPSAREYAELLERGDSQPEEIEALAALLSVGETYFWRYAGQFLALQGILIPSLLRARGPRDGRLRIWSAGCATGEEVYSLVIACLEALQGACDVEVVGTDIHRPSLARAATGSYRARGLRNLPSHLRRKYLEAGPEGARVTGALRQRSRFEFLNLGGGALGQWIAEKGPFDVIFCRNTLIYFDLVSVERVIDALEAGLSEGGGLFLGAAETLHAQRAGLEPVHGMGSFFYRRRVQPPVAPANRVEPVNLGADQTRAARLYESGLARLDGEDFEEAREAFRAILELRPEDARGHTGLALILANDGREAEAAVHLERAVQGGPVLAETRYLMGLVAERRGSALEALQHYGEALAVAPEFFMAHINRAWVLRRMGRRRAFLEEMSSALHILRGRPRVAPWITGGMGWDALADLVAEAVNGEGATR